MGVGPAECGLQGEMQPVETDRQRNVEPAHHLRLDAIERHLETDGGSGDAHAADCACSAAPAFLNAEAQGMRSSVPPSASSIVLSLRPRCRRSQFWNSTTRRSIAEAPGIVFCGAISSLGQEREEPAGAPHISAGKLLLATHARTSTTVTRAASHDSLVDLGGRDLGFASQCARCRAASS
jgi:hypothetical protein